MFSRSNPPTERTTMPQATRRRSVQRKDNESADQPTNAHQLINWTSPDSLDFQPPPPLHPFTTNHPKLSLDSHSLPIHLPKLIHPLFHYPLPPPGNALPQQRCGSPNPKPSPHPNPTFINPLRTFHRRTSIPFIDNNGFRCCPPQKALSTGRARSHTSQNRL